VADLSATLFLLVSLSLRREWVLVTPLFILVEQLDPEILELRHIQAGGPSLLDHLVALVEALLESTEWLVGVKTLERGRSRVLHAASLRSGAH
jgi:hypothetical protein